MAIEFTNTELPDLIELKNISQLYKGAKDYTIKDFNLLIEQKPDQGQFIVLLGPSGCGKSTILRYIAGLQKPSSGEILIDAKPQTEDNRINMIFQKYSSFEWMTVLENVELGLKFKGVDKKERREQAMEMIKMVELEGHENKYAKYPTLSGGQLQRVAIARSLLADSRTLLMDEPFGALDINSRLRMQDRIINIWKRIHPTIILVTHDISEAVYLGDDVYIMNTNPGRLEDYIHIDLPFERTRETKRTSHFIDLVRHIEDKMVALAPEAILVDRI